jgi:hypothetical protein
MQLFYVAIWYYSVDGVPAQHVVQSSFNTKGYSADKPMILYSPLSVPTRFSSETRPASTSVFVGCRY